MTSLNTFPRWLADQIDKSHLKLKDIATAANLSTGYISMLQKGNKARPSRETVERIAAAIGDLLEKPKVELIESAFKAAGMESPPTAGLRPEREPIRSPTAIDKMKWAATTPVLATLSPTSEHLRESIAVHRREFGIVLRLDHFEMDEGRQWMVASLKQDELAMESAALTMCSVRWLADDCEIALFTLTVGQMHRLLAPPSRTWEFHLTFMTQAGPQGTSHVVISHQEVSEAS